jgi:signal transduction histidine kinase
MEDGKLMSPRDASSVLVVDDIQENLQIVGNILRRNNFDVRIAQSGQDALRSVEYDPPDLVLLDISMPQMDGYEVCRRLKAMDGISDIPVIFLTAAYTSSEDAVKGFQYGAVDYIKKPFHDEELLVRVSTHIELFKAKRDLERKGRWRQRFFTILAHDIRNPMSGIHGLSNLMLDEYSRLTEAEKLEYLKEIKNASGSALHILEDVVTWSRSETGMVTVKIEAIPLLRLVQTVVEELQLLYEQKGIHIELELKADNIIWADESLLLIILRNLVTNAIKFTHPGGTVRIESLGDYHNAGVAVRDNGIGISEEKLETLFQQPGSSSNGTTGEKGSGLGLEICSRLVEIQNGTIRVESRVNEGSVFFVTFPKKTS